MTIHPATGAGLLPLPSSPPTSLSRTDPTSGTQQATGDDPQLRETFDSFVGETFFSQMLGAMRKTQGKPAYFHGGQAEEIFQGQLDQMLAEKLAASSASQFTGPMFELFNVTRS